MFKVTQDIAPTFISELFEIKGRYREDTMTLRSDSNKTFETPKPKLNVFKNSLSYLDALIWKSIRVEIRNANMIDAFVNKCLTWIKDLKSLYSFSHTSSPKKQFRWFAEPKCIYTYFIKKRFFPTQRFILRHFLSTHIHCICIFIVMFVTLVSN